MMTRSTVLHVLDESLIDDLGRAGVTDVTGRHLKMHRVHHQDEAAAASYTSFIAAHDNATV